MSWVGKVAKIGGMVGMIIPAALLIILGIIYLATGGQSNMDFHSSFSLTLPTLDNVVLCCQYLPVLCRYGNGRYPRKDVENPSKNYPKAVFIGALITVLIFVLGTFALWRYYPCQGY